MSPSGGQPAAENREAAVTVMPQAIRGRWSDCGCEPRISLDGVPRIAWCPTHAQAPAMKEALERMLSILNPNVKWTRLQTAQSAEEWKMSTRALLRAIEGA